MPILVHASSNRNHTMVTNVRGYAARSTESALGLFDFVRRDPRPKDVSIEILYTGVCHSDIHSVRNDWANAKFPLVPGHEIVGRVTDVGAEVRRFKVGDAVGVGCMVDSCQHCASCARGLEQYCENGNTQTYNDVDRHDGSSTYGGYSERIVVSEKFVLKMPEDLDLKGAAPLLCAGITTWSLLRHWKVGPGSRVAVVGLGGLGHMALKLARALGADVTLFSRSSGKEKDALRLGAHRVVISTDAARMAEVQNTFDLIINTVPTVHDLNPYVGTLTRDGTMVLVGYLGPLNDPFITAPLVIGRKSVAGSAIGGIAETQEMLDFCGEHGITSDIEVIKIQSINEAYERVLRSDVRYHFVIDMASL